MTAGTSKLNHPHEVKLLLGHGRLIKASAVYAISVQQHTIQYGSLFPERKKFVTFLIKSEY
jgi:hypothetical protein